MILVTGAVGFIGRHVVRELMKLELPVRVLLPPEYKDPIPWDVADPFAPQMMSGSILDSEFLFKSVQGVHTIIHLESAMWWGRRRDLERVEISGTQKLVDVARAARVGRIIVLSQLGASPSSAYNLHLIKGRCEEIIRGSGLAFTIIRVGVVFGEDDAFINHIAMMLKTNPIIFFMPGNGDVVLHPLHIDDLSRAIMRCLESLDAVDRTIEIGGIEYTTLSDLIRTIMRVCRIWRLVIPVPPYIVRTLLRVYGLFARRTFMTLQWLDILATNRTTQLGNMYDNFGFQPRRLEDTLVTYLPQKASFLKAIRYAFKRRPKAQ
jgi:nucleoside-diphosphate-sugar epimerase